ncbi:MAG TPA: GldG family protein [Sedimentisphaerales bacterium]|nr:GldG family protein [Sedimentisphaerales bacterium]
MNRTLRAITAVIFVGIIVFCAVSICQNVGGALRADITDQKLYTLSAGTRAIVGKLNQPIKLKLYYTRTAARKAPDQIRFYNNYYYFVEALLREYARASRGMINLEVIDPRPYSDQEEEALRYGLRRFPITDEESFFFGLVLQTEFGVVKTIPFFSPDRQNFIEYDISHLIDTAITREKRRIGVLSSLPVMGEDVSGYMAYLRQVQGQPPSPPWTIVQQLQQQYSVTKVEREVEEIKDVDILLVIHPKDLPEKTLFAIDQFVLKGGRAIICVDPRCLADNVRDPMGRQTGEPGSELNKLLRTWGVEMPADTFAGDRFLALDVQLDRNERLQKLIGYLSLPRECVNADSVITANLNEVRLLFPGVLEKTTAADGDKSGGGNEIIPLLQTTASGNTWRVEGPWDWIRINPEKMMSYFKDGSEPVVMGYLLKGRFKSSFPDGIEVADETGKEGSGEDKNESEGGDEAAKEKKAAKRLTGLAEASADCAVIVFADVDFISDMVAYRETVFGMKMAVANNSDLLLNAIDDLSGSGDLIGIRSRGNFQRPFVVVDEIVRKAEQETAAEVGKINEEKARLEKELQQVVSSAGKGEEAIIAQSFLDKQRELEVKIRQTERELRQVQKKRREKIEQLGGMLQNLNTWAAPVVILVIAVILSIRRSVLRRRYVSHASDA